MATDTISFGGDIVLTCTVHGIQTIDSKSTRQWSMGDDDELLCYNGRINNLKKYEENIFPGNEFSLTIFNVTESDLNVVYQCRYGFDAASKLIEADEPDFFLSLRLVTDFIIFGGYIILTCVVNGISTIDNEVTRQWSMGNDDQLLSYDGRINNHRKYEETILPGNEFSLKIFNVTEKDLNVTYRCRYGFDVANKFIEINEHNYIYPPKPESTTISYLLENQNDTMNISIHFEKVFPLPNCSITTIDYATIFNIFDLIETERVMEVNLSVSLQKRVACNKFNISCHVAGQLYDIEYERPKDFCSLKETVKQSTINPSEEFGNNFILPVILIFLVVFILVPVLVTVKGFLSKRRNNTRRETKEKKQDDTEDMVDMNNSPLI
ncbi:unnamed protein product [Mytilus coruscus]|uniref:Ig-like domain-containing protein n=1 Tax=Mytilus coruscus TaxID=42192 RepID=A0A6J8ELQ9_MYTCO|nr:unnamed protein product [Mytilus coruscus]